MRGCLHFHPSQCLTYPSTYISTGPRWRGMSLSRDAQTFLPVTDYLPKLFQEDAKVIPSDPRGITSPAYPGVHLGLLPVGRTLNTSPKRQIATFIVAEVFLCPGVMLSGAIWTCRASEGKEKYSGARARLKVTQNAPIKKGQINLTHTGAKP